MSFNELQLCRMVYKHIIYIIYIYIITSSTHASLFVIALQIFQLFPYIMHSRLGYKFFVCLFVVVIFFKSSVS